MQKRLKSAIWPARTPKPRLQEEVSPLEKLEQLQTAMPLAGYIRQAGLVPGIIPIAPATLWRWVANGTFPEPVKLSPRVTAWRIEDIKKWLLEKI